MKIPASIRTIYEDQRDLNEKLKLEIDSKIKGLIEPRWHYESRVKELISFAIKLETGRVLKPHELEDFFACTIVVQNASQINVAYERISENFVICEKRPKSDDFTSKASNSFPFDDLRLYCKQKPNPILPPKELSEVIFEIQIKTFLQHAWSIATHDLVYKSDDANWSQERIAYQIKAMLEHAEVSIQQASDLANCEALKKDNREILSIKKSIDIIKKNWSKEDLPRDIRRVAQNILSACQLIDISLEVLDALLDEKKQQRGGTHPLNTSPYSTVVQYIIESNEAGFLAAIQSTKKRGKILIPSELILPTTLDRTRSVNAIFL
ncbi:hypothetical protein [Pseudomonas sp. zfem005]|uniref:hypothetical protein n=1 Tax=Pseudomonas sp. zfem005 TaxID=3078200 RepID=UPI00292969FD|nr:hypothetical protein [Pseudomonas sp. zfem005]MDU9414992.1 hypothetical protein [Pseudomonas sp. zfem005]